MIVDASALLAIVLDEPEAQRFEEMIVGEADPKWMSPMNFLEAAVRVDRLGSDDKSHKFDQILVLLDIQIAEVDAKQALLAREAYQRYGKGNHAARLNLGDCFAYALAKARNEPLLYKGGDFGRTDVKAAL